MNYETTAWLPLGGLLNLRACSESRCFGPGTISNILHIFGVGGDSQMYHVVVDASSWVPSLPYAPGQPATPWQPPNLTGWESVGGCFSSAPAVVLEGDRIDIFGLGANHSMWHRAWENGSWIIDWEDLGGVFDSPPAAVSWGPNRLDIFGLGTDDQMYHKWGDGRSWQPSQTDWQGLGGIFNSAPAAVATSANHLDIFALGTDNQMLHKAWIGDHWSPALTGWDDLNGTLVIPPATQMPSEVHFDAVVTFPDGVAIGGSVHVSLFKDGTSTFSGSLHDSGAVAYNCAVACGVYDSQRRLYPLTQSGYAAGTFEPGSRDFNWNEPGDPNPNPKLREYWNDLFGCGGAQFKCVANVGVDGAALLPSLLLPGVGEVISLVTKSEFGGWRVAILSPGFWRKRWRART